jgi:hypothetical protein
MRSRCIWSFSHAGATCSSVSRRRSDQPCPTRRTSSRPPHWRTRGRPGGPAVWPRSTRPAARSPGGAGRSPTGGGAGAGRAGPTPCQGGRQARWRCWWLAIAGSPPGRQGMPAAMRSPAPRLERRRAGRCCCDACGRRSPGGVRGARPAWPSRRRTTVVVVASSLASWAGLACCWQRARR